ncbi:ATP-binding protein [Lactobacillus johnsonii]|uniref:ATP-binding protein n=1 Tax=Lactobacillus johnsonii TaxID=33959 RepID=A0A9X7XU34_LACJH|nr:ATP-binding protein [Lactobacillus johnsonii]QIA87677.1 ATP-binding protein [Lactobacillus johnsonii]QXL46957.1 ATP-binding protein [Lactobacillus johnsonii]TGY31566.1 ATP-binding protein [Lactobacillus johnsonii]WNW29204.1 ATP-binding protein [Lactobacillus johnsonii]
MLIEFTVKNYASFKDETTLSSETGSRLRKLKETNTFSYKNPALLKSLLLFGPNGSGKSQLINALSTMENLVTRPTRTVTDKLPYHPFLFSKDSKHADTVFKVKIELHNKIYEYSFSYNQDKISYEALILTENNKKRTIFYRNESGVRTSNKLLEESVPKLRDNSLFLYLAQSENHPESSEVYKWFAQDLILLGNGYSLMIPDEYLELMNNEYLKKEMISFLSFADFNISDIKIREIPNPVYEQIFKLLRHDLVENLNVDSIKNHKELYTIHKIYDDDEVIDYGELPLSNESVGTQRLFYIVLAMMLAQINGNRKTIVIDEFDDSLHVELASALVKIFNSKENMNQFIVTTHDVQLLDSALRIDQIYLLDKDFHGISNLKSIFDFEDARNKGRRDISFAKRYLQGKFGAVPVIDVEGLLDVLQMIHEKYGDEDGKKE